MNKLKLTSVAIFMAMLTACQNTEISTSSKVNVPEQFEYATSQQTENINEIQKWWLNWHNPQLNELIEEGLKNNLDIAIAQMRLQEALANSRLAEADLGPMIGLGGNIGRGEVDLDSNIINPDSVSTNNASATLSMSWEPDVFGKKRSDADMAKEAALGYQEKVYGTQLLITSQIAENYFKIHAIEEKSAVINQGISTLKQLERYVRGRFQAGQATSYEIEEVTQKMSLLQAQQTTLKAQADYLQRNIAILLGKTPQNFRVKKSKNIFTNIPKAPQGIVPSSVIERRPDIRANAHIIKVNMAKLASAKADLLPRFNIHFLGQNGRIELNHDLANVSGIGGLFGIGVQLPIFTNGRIQANIDNADASLKAALIQYDKTLLTALGEVDSTYQMQAALIKQTQLLEKAYKQATTQANNAQKLFTYGEKTLDVALRARLTSLEYQQKIIQSRLASTENLLNLYKALGGGWTEDRK